MINRPYFAAYYRWLVVQHALALPRRATRVLDVGCDDGYITHQVSADVRLGVDMLPRLRPADDFAVVRAAAEQIPLLEGSFDCILAFDVLEHIVQDRVVMCEMLRVLAPGGTLWFSTPARETIIFPWFLLPYTNRSFGHVRNGYTPEQLAALLPDATTWEMQVFFWNEPLLRAGFVALHLFNRLYYPAAVWLTRFCYCVDRRFSQGQRGHLFGTIRHRKTI